MAIQQGDKEKSVLETNNAESEIYAGIYTKTTFHIKYV